MTERPEHNRSPDRHGESDPQAAGDRLTSAENVAIGVLATLVLVLFLVPVW